MMRYRTLLVYSALLLALGAASGQQEQPAAKDLYGDPLPPGTIARLGTVRLRHDTAIVFAAFLPGCKSILSVSQDGVLCVWDFPTGEQLRRVEMLTGTTTTVSSATLSPDGKRLTAFSEDGLMRIWDWEKSKELNKIVGAAKVVKTPKVGPGGGFGGGFGKAAKPVPPLAPPVYSADGKTLMVFSGSRVIQLVDLDSGKEFGSGPGHTDAITSILFTSDGKKIITHDAQAAQVWDATTSKHLGALNITLPELQGSPTIISPDGAVGVTVAIFPTPAKAQAAKSRDAVIFDTATGQELGKIALDVEIAQMHRKPLVFSPDGKILAASTEDAQPRIHLYDIPSGKLLRTLDPNPGAPAPPPAGGPIGWKTYAQKMLFSPDGKALAFQSSPGSPIIVIDTMTGKQLASLTFGSSKAMKGTFTPDSRCLALENTDGTVTLYELATGKARLTYGGKMPPAAADKADMLAELLGLVSANEKIRFSIAITPDGKSMALPGPGGSVQIWDMLTAKAITALKGHHVSVNSLAFAPNGKTLASASDDTTALLWDMTKIDRPALPAKALQAGDLEKLWQELANEDGAKGFPAMVDLVATPKESVAWIKDHVKPAAPLDKKLTQKLIKQLDQGNYAERVKTSKDLSKQGELVVPELQATLKGELSAQAREQIEKLITQLMAPELQGDRLTSYRAVEVLELIGTPEARQVLQSLADGAPGALITTSAKAALKR